jgi:hypothetical protein
MKDRLQEGLEKVIFDYLGPHMQRQEIKTECVSGAGDREMTMFVSVTEKPSYAELEQRVAELEQLLGLREN